MRIYVIGRLRSLSAAKRRPTSNLYSLFVERALRLVKPGGLVGLLTPSGIYADKTAARFFKSVSTTGRVAGIYDFENRRLGTDCRRSSSRH